MVVPGYTSYQTLVSAHTQSKEVYGCEAYGQTGDEGAATTGGVSYFTSSQQQQKQQQLDGAAPCADGLDWGFDRDGFSHINTFTNRTPNKIWVKESSLHLCHDDKDTRGGVALAPVSTAGSARYSAPLARILLHQEYVMTDYRASRSPRETHAFADPFVHS